MVMKALRRPNIMVYPYHMNFQVMQPNIEQYYLWHSYALVSFILCDSNNMLVYYCYFAAVTMALGSLTIWHIRLIRRGETSIEAHINQSETKRLAALGKTYINPYNFGSKQNFLLFLGLVRRRTFWRHVLLPSAHLPEGNGLTWRTINDANNMLIEWQ